MIDYDVDMSTLDDTIDEVAGAGAALSDPAFINKASAAIRDKLRDWFYDYIDAVATANPRALHHVYEWGEIGNSKLGSRLFTIFTTGSNQFSSRFSYEFLPSQENVPRDSGLEDDTRTRQNVFVYKALVLEEGLTVEIKPLEDNTGGRNGEGILAFPGSDGMGYATELTINHESGPNTGQFALHWNEWWENSAEPQLQKRFIEAGERSLARLLPMRIKQAGSNKMIIETPRFSIRKNNATKMAIEKEIMRIIYDA